MKNFKYSIAFLAIVALLFTSCSKDEANDTASPDIQETFQLQFGALLNDFSTKLSKDHLIEDPVECRVADPSYVLVALTDSNNDWVAGKNPTAGNANLNDFIKIPIKNNNGSWETDFSPELGLPAGTYFLEYFIVYSADDEVLWVAPREGGAYASSVADPLPQTIVLGAGTKPYVDVDVLCYVPRVEEAFGYIFFDINLIEVENNYCIFVNYCGTTGRDYPAKFEVDVWSDDFDGSDLVIDGTMNSVSGAGNNFAATVLCFPLPPLDGNDVYYVRVTVLDTDAYDLGAENEFEFTISQDDIDDQLDETPRYEHIRINCGDDGGNGECDPQDADADCDNDGISNGDDECKGEGVRGNVDEVGCPIIDPCDQTHPNYNTFDCDGDTIPNGVDNCPSMSNTDQADFDQDELGDVCDPDDDNDDILDGDENIGCRLNPDPNCGEVVTPTCIRDVPNGCVRFGDEFTKDASALQIIELAFGDLTLEFTQDGLSVGLTPIAPFEISDMEVLINNTPVCLEVVEPDKGGVIIIEGLNAGDAPISVGLQVNYCDISP